MNRMVRWIGVGSVFVLCLGVATAQTQQAPVAAEPQAPSQTAEASSVVVPPLAVPRLIKFAGTLKDAQGKPLGNTVGLTFAIYKEQEGGAPLWLETQNAQLDEQGHYSVLLGATKSEGLPLELFSSGEPRWLGIQVQSSGEVEGSRVLLVSVPYALKAADADTLGGLPASAFVLAAPIGTALGTSVSGSSTLGNGNLNTPGNPTLSGTGNTAALLAPKATVSSNATSANFVPGPNDVTGVLTFVGITPCRIIETRGLGFAGQAGPPSLVAGAQRTFQMTGTVGGVPTQCGIPDTAQAVSINFTVTNFGSGYGDIRVFPAGGTLPLTSILDYHLETLANATTVPLGPSGGGHNGITVQADGAGTDFLADVNGYYVPVASTPGILLTQLLGNLSTAAASGYINFITNYTPPVDATAFTFMRCSAGTTAAGQELAFRSAIRNPTGGTVTIGTAFYLFPTSAGTETLFNENNDSFNLTAGQSYDFGINNILSAGGTLTCSGVVQVFSR